MGVCDLNEQLWLLQSLLPDYNLPGLTSLPFENCPGKRQLERFSVKATVCNFSPPGRKWIASFPPQHLSLTLMSCLLWNSILPEAKISDIPQTATGIAGADAKPRKKKKVLMFAVFLNRFSSDARWAPHFVFASVVVVAMTHLDRDNLGYTHRKGNLNVLNIIGKSDKQEDLHLNTRGQWQTSAAYGSPQG